MYKDKSGYWQYGWEDCVDPMMWLEAAPIKVIHRRENGSGIIEIPITMVQGEAVDSAMIDQMIANLEQHPVVPIGVGEHREYNERSGPAPGFVDSLRRRGASMFAVLDLGPELFSDVELGRFRSFSIEALNGLKQKAQSGQKVRDIDGWVLVGGVFTNRAATDTHFKIAAETRPGSESTGTFTVPLTHCPENSGNGESMSEETKPAPAIGAEVVTKAFFDAKIKDERDKSAALEAARTEMTGRLEVLTDENKRLRLEAEQASTTATDATNDKLAAEAKVNRLEAEARGQKEANATLRTTVTELTERLEKESTANLTTKVIAVRDAAVAEGVPPALFEGIDADPAGWMSSRFANFDAFQSHYKILSGSSRDLVTDPPKSGHDPSKRTERKLDASTETRLRRMGLDPKYVGIKSEGELLALQAEKKEKGN